jgi:hypothetical protein
MSKSMERGGRLKRSMVIVAGIMLSTAAFALDVSAGVSVSSGFFVNRMNTSNSSLGVSSDLTNISLPLAAEVFLDAQYFEIGAGYRLRVLGHQKQNITVTGAVTTPINAGTGLKGYVAVSLSLKYPVVVGKSILFPLVGFERDFNVLSLDANWGDLRGGMNAQQLANEDQLWLKAGMGARFPLGAWGYFGIHYVLGWKVPNQPENDLVTNAKLAGFDATLVSLEPDVGIAVGFKL